MGQLFVITKWGSKLQSGIAWKLQSEEKKFKKWGRYYKEGGKKIQNGVGIKKLGYNFKVGHNKSLGSQNIYLYMYQELICYY